jgi:hypothetical protein
VLAPRTIFVAAGVLGLCVPLLLGPALIRRTRSADACPEPAVIKTAESRSEPSFSPVDHAVASNL